MEDNILINIKTYQGTNDTEPISLETTGRFGMINGKYYIMYKETELTGFPDTATTVKICDKVVTVKRKGKFNMKISYAEGDQMLCLYPTQYGKISARIKTLRVYHKMNFKNLSGSVVVEYTLDTDNSDAEINRLCIDVKPIEVKVGEKSTPVFEHRGFTTIN